MLGGIAAGLVGAGIDAGVDAFSASQANRRAERMQLRQFQFNREEAATARDWQARYLNDRHAIEVGSLKRAGLNPMLSVMKGSAAPAPAVAAASGSAPPSHKADSSRALRGVASALQATRLKKDIEVANSTIGLNNQAALAKASETEKNNSSAKNLNASTKALNATLGAVRAEAKTRAQRAGYEQSHMGVRQYNKTINELLGTASGAADLVNPLRRFPKMKSPLKKEMDFKKNYYKKHGVPPRLP